ncbi:MAG: glycosyltransferase family 2 protein [Armatimonadota bacterium]
MQALVAIFWSCWGAIFYTYFLFPVLLALLARIRGAAPPAPAGLLRDEELPRVALVVAAFNERATMAAKIANSLAIDYPSDRLEVLVGSDGSNDGTDEILRRVQDPRVRAFLFDERRGKISVLNDLAARSGADILVMSDANTMIAPDAVRKLVRHFADPRVGCVSGELTLEQEGGASGEGLYWKYESWIKRSESRLGFLIGCNGGIYAVRRSLYVPLPRNTVVDDFVLCMRVLEQGFRVRFDPEARAFEPPCPSARAEMVRKIRIGAGGFQAIGLTYRLLHPRFGAVSFAYWGHKVLRWCVPLMLLAAWAVNLPLSGVEPYRSLLLAQLGGAALAACAYHRRPGTALPRWTRPFSYFYLMNFALFLGLIRFLFRSQKVTWDRGRQ